MTPLPCVISVSDHAGWAHLVCVAAVGYAPTVVDRRRVTTIDAGLPTMPYHHESLELPEGEANALIARVQRSIAERTADALRTVIADLTPRHRIVALAIREPPFPELPDSVAPIRRSYPLQCAADGMMYQIAMCRAARDLGLEVSLCRRGEETALAATQLGVSVRDVDVFITRTGRPPGPPWADEHRRAFAAGIAALAPHTRHPLTVGHDTGIRL